MQKLLKLPFIKNTLTLLSGNVIGQFVPLLFTPVLSRIYSPSEFAVFGIIIGFNAIIWGLLTGRLDLAIVLPNKELYAKVLFWLSVLINLTLNGLIFIIIVIWRNKIASFYNMDILAYLLFFLPILNFVTGLSLSLKGIVNRYIWFKYFAISNILRAISVNTLSVLLGLLKFGAFGLLLSLIIGLTLQQVYLIIKFLKKRKDIFTVPLNVRLFKRTIKRYKTFSIQSGKATIINSLSNQLPFVTFNKFFSVTSTGFYYQTFKIINSPINVISRALGQSFFQRIAEKFKNGIDFGQDVKKMYLYLFKILIVPFIILILFGDKIFVFVLGEEWRESGKIAMIIAPWILFNFIANPLIFIFEVLSKQKVLFYINVVLLVLRIASILIGKYVYDDFIITVVLFSLVSFSVYYYICFYFLRSINGGRNIALSTISLFLILASTLLFIRYICF